jgi:hypothetical protein
VDVEVVSAEPPPRRVPRVPGSPADAEDWTERVPNTEELFESSVCPGESTPGPDPVQSATADEVIDESEAETLELLPRTERKAQPSELPAPPYAGAPERIRNVDELVGEFQVAEVASETELRRELKKLAGIEQTPAISVDVTPR